MSDMRNAAFTPADAPDAVPLAERQWENAIALGVDVP